ncbi:MAG: hypothetical protein IPM57_00150 [Oligoflexia bacterium]|nr:hypothetical protein [Oligoflexia bacterium]
MLRKCLELLGLIDSKKEKPIWLLQTQRGTIDGAIIFRLMSEKSKKRKGLWF